VAMAGVFTVLALRMVSTRFPLSHGRGALIESVSNPGGVFARR
jgi:hypothetical protein